MTFRAALVCTALSISVLAESHRPGDLSVEPHSFRTYDGSEHSAELDHLWVRENRGGSSDRLIEIAFVRLRTTAAKPGSPVVFLAGGPGIPGTTLGRVPVYFDLFKKLQASADVILLDQRGTGTSSDMQCPQAAAPPVDVFVKESSFREALLARARSCAEYWRGKGVDVAAFGTSAAADDLEDLRRALGAAKLSLLGHSYGTSLALEAVQRHGENLDRVVLAGVEGPNRALKMPLVFDFALRRLSKIAAANTAFPNIYDEFRRVLDQLDREPLTVHIHSERTKQDIDVRVGPFVALFVIKDMLANGRRAGTIPDLIYSLGRRDASLLTPMVHDLYESLVAGFAMMPFSVLCSEGWSEGRRRIAEEQARHSVFGGVPFVHLDPRLCSDIGIARTEPLSPIWSTVPALLISGTLDSNTPPAQAREALWGLPNGTVVVVENGFHETLPSPEVQAIVAEFLAGGDVRGRVVKFPPM